MDVLTIPSGYTVLLESVRQNTQQNPGHGAEAGETLSPWAILAIAPDKDFLGKLGLG